MSVEQVTVYKAGDGTLHETMADAVKADASYELHSFIDKNGGQDAQVIYDFILLYRKQLYALLVEHLSAG